MGCAKAPGSQTAGTEGQNAADAGGTMTQARMEMLFADEVDAIIGAPGAIQTRVDDINVFLLSDEANDRMRIIAPIAMAANLDKRMLRVLLRANFHTALDARYAISEGVVYAAFLHPISSLSSESIGSALSQVLSLVKTFGTSFSGGEVHFDGDKNPTR